MSATLAGDALFGRVLSCYKPHCRYLKAVTVTAEEHPQAVGRFEIAESCYIDDTGHLNAVEVNICYNQLLYTTIAATVHKGIGPVLGTWTIADFERRQLSDIVIARFTAEFRRPITPRRFEGELTVDRILSRQLRTGTEPFVSIATSFRFWDDNGGTCSGSARVAITGGRTDG